MKRRTHPVSATTSPEIEHLQRALADAEAEVLRLREHHSLEMARLERQVYWLDRWGIDLDAWMRRRPVRLALRTLGFLLRLPRRLREARR
jgi:hypothetical protein